MAAVLRSEKLPVGTKVLYGVAEFGISMMTSALQFFLIYLPAFKRFTDFSIP